jgi:RNA polymerase sigma factor (sigma-70 family)
MRHHRRAQGRHQFPNGRRNPPGDDLTPPELLEHLERVDVVRAALLCLEDDRRRVLLLKYAEGLSVAAIADRTGRSAKAVESLLSRARAQLRDLLQPYFSHATGGQRREPTDARPTR